MPDGYNLLMNVSSTKLAPYAHKKLEMADRKDPVLHQPAAPVDVKDENLGDVFIAMESVMRQQGGCGLAAPQVGIPHRMMVVDVGNGAIHLANPKITEREGWAPSIEGCLSLKGTLSVVGRSRRVTVEAHDKEGQPFTMRCNGFKALAMQHELDHLNGTLMTDRKGVNITPLRAAGGATGLIAGALLRGVTGSAIGGVLGVAAGYGVEKLLGR